MDRKVEFASVVAAIAFGVASGVGGEKMVRSMVRSLEDLNAGMASISSSRHKDCPALKTAESCLEEAAYPIVLRR